MSTIEKNYTVEGLGGEEGESLVESALCTLGGVESVEADSMMDLVVVRYDPSRVSEKDMQEVMDELGFDMLPR